MVTDSLFPRLPAFQQCMFFTWGRDYNIVTHVHVASLLVACSLQCGIIIIIIIIMTMLLCAFMLNL